MSGMTDQPRNLRNTIRKHMGDGAIDITYQQYKRTMHAGS